MKRIFVLLIFVLLLIKEVLSQNTVGFISNTTGASDGFVLFSPTQSQKTFLIDKCGYEVHTWTSFYKPGQAVYLLEDGSLLRTGNIGNDVFTSGGTGGIIEKYDWNNNLTWSYVFSDEQQCQHHDVCPLPNGNILVLSWEKKTEEEAIEAGRNPDLLGASLWSEKIVEIQPVGLTGAIITWEWHVWDHLVQEFDPEKYNYQTVADHPELIHLNFLSGMPNATDWLHCNAVDYNEELDQVMISSHNFSEVWIIDHSTTTEEAALHTGGAHERGGDLLFRWGNAATYQRGTAGDKKFFGQHNTHWIKSGLEDEGKIMVFNNGFGRPEGDYSTIEIIDPVSDFEGNYIINPGESFLPVAADWMYIAETPEDFYSSNISGAHRLLGGNTMICEGATGRFFEIDNQQNVVWTYFNPVGINGAVSQGDDPVQNMTFRCTQYAADYPGLPADLSPTVPLENNPLPYECSLTASIQTTVHSLKDEIVIANPFADRIDVFSSIAFANSNWVLTDVLGKQEQVWTSVQISAASKTELVIDHSLPGGIYFLRMQTDDAGAGIIFKLVH